MNTTTHITDTQLQQAATRYLGEPFTPWQLSTVRLLLQGERVDWHGEGFPGRTEHGRKAAIGLLAVYWHVAPRATARIRIDHRDGQAFARIRHTAAARARTFRDYQLADRLDRLAEELLTTEAAADATVASQAATRLRDLAQDRTI